MLTKQQKSELIDTLTASFEASAAVVVADFKGISHKDLEGIRKECAGADVEIQVIKNTLANVALEKAGMAGLELTGNSVFMWGEDLVTLAKQVTKFAKDSENITIKTGHFEGEVVDDKKIEAYSKLASKEEFLGMLLSVWTAPTRNILSVWTANAREFVTALDAIKAQKEEAA